MRRFGEPDEAFRDALAELDAIGAMFDNGSSSCGWPAKSPIAEPCAPEAHSRSEADLTLVERFCARITRPRSSPSSSAR